MDGFLELGSEFKLPCFTEEIAFGEGVGCDGVFVTPMFVAQIGGAFAVLLEAVIEEVEYAIGDGCSELFRNGGFAMTEVGEESESGHGDWFLLAPAAVFILVVLEPT